MEKTQTETILRMRKLVLMFLEVNRIPDPGYGQVESLVMHLYRMAQGAIRVECAWCGKVLQEGVGPTSHGICQRCVALGFSRRPQ